MKSWFSAAGLYYLAELVEEYSTVAKKIIWWMNAVCYTYYLGAECSAGVFLGGNQPLCVPVAI